MENEAYFPSDAWIQKQLAAVYEVSDYAQLYKQLVSLEARLRDRTPDTFGQEYLSAKLALAAVAWEECCDENKISDEEYRKKFLKKIMDQFQSPKFTAMASSFSEYFYAPGSEKKELPVLSVSKHLFDRLDIPAKKQPEGGSEEVSAAFRTMVDILESFKMKFQDDFYTAIEE